MKNYLFLFFIIFFSQTALAQYGSYCDTCVFQLSRDSLNRPQNQGGKPINPNVHRETMLMLDKKLQKQVLNLSIAVNNKADANNVVNLTSNQSVMGKKRWYDTIVGDNGIRTTQINLQNGKLTNLQNGTSPQDAINVSQLSIESNTRRVNDSTEKAQREAADATLQTAINQLPNFVDLSQYPTKSDISRKVGTDSLEANKLIGNLIETNGENDVVLEPRNGTTLGVTKYRYGNNSIPVFDGASDVSQPFVRYSQNGHQFVGKVLTSRRAADSNEVVQKVELDEAKELLTARVDSTIRISDSSRISGDVVVFYVFGDFQEKRTWRHEHKAKLDRARPNDLSRPYPTILSARNAAAKMIVTKKIYEAKIVVLQSHQKERWIHNNFKNEVITTYEILDDNDNPTGVFAQDTAVDYLISSASSFNSYRPNNLDSTSIGLFYPNLTYYFEQNTGIDYIKAVDNSFFFHGHTTGLPQKITGHGQFSIFLQSTQLTWRNAAELKGGEVLECESFNFKRSYNNGFNPFFVVNRSGAKIKIKNCYVKSHGMSFAIATTANSLNSEHNLNIDIDKLYIDEDAANNNYEFGIFHLLDVINTKNTINVSNVYAQKTVTPLFSTIYNIVNSQVDFNVKNIVQTYSNDTSTNTPLIYFWSNDGVSRYENSTVNINLENVKTMQPILNIANSNHINTSINVNVKLGNMTFSGANATPKPMFLINQFNQTKSYIKISCEQCETIAGSSFNLLNNTNTLLSGRYSTTGFPAINVNGDNSKVLLNGLFSTTQPNSIIGTGTITVMPSASANVGVGAGVTLNGTLSVNPNFRF